MPRLVIKDVDLVKILVKHYGFYIVSRKGSHIKLFDRKGHMTVVSVHNEEVRQGTLNAILRQTGLRKEDIIRHA
jgi:predicted RNA binding protein YcfA (HicA-like mRNA interferase family)